jgi:D-alanyl-D-alanine carboxypeptidase
MRRFALSAQFCLALITTVVVARADAVDELIREDLRKYQVAGLACMILQKDLPTRTACHGVANREWNVPVTEDTVFEIGSVTKQFTAAGILLLAQDGKLSVDDKISRHLTNTPPTWADITIRHLLNHTSGITNYDSLDGFELRLRLTQEKFVRKLAAHPPVFKPGDAWAYCNSSYSLLGFIIENASGKTYWQFLDERIFQPLQMTNTTRRDSELIIPRRAAGYEKVKGSLVNRDYDLTDLGAAGAMVSTVADLAKWNAALNGDKLLNESSQQQWWTPTRLNDGTTKDYGFGWFLSPLDGHRNIGHSGSTSGFSASLQRFPDDGLTIIVLSNTGESGFSTKLAKKIAPLLLKKKPAAP